VASPCGPEACEVPEALETSEVVAEEVGEVLHLREREKVRLG
jgi:hypothetical protein